MKTVASQSFGPNLFLAALLALAASHSAKATAETVAETTAEKDSMD